MNTIKCLTLWLLLTNAFTQVVTDEIIYSINVDTIHYTIGDTIHWSAKMVNISQDTIQFENNGNGQFFRWFLWDSAYTIFDSFVIIDCTDVYIIPPSDSLINQWPYILTDFWSDYFPFGLYYGLMKPWFNSDSLEYDTVSFRVLERLSIQEPTASIPTQYELHQPYPNPFNPVTEIEYSIPEYVFVHLRVYDILGREIQTLVYGEKNAGKYSVGWNGNSFPSGIYIISLTSGKFLETRKVLLLK